MSSKLVMESFSKHMQIDRKHYGVGKGGGAAQFKALNS